VAEDETWCFRCDPTTKRQSAEWKSSASPKGKKSLSSKVKSEDNACVFLRQQGIIHHEFVPEGQTVTGSF
jgi:hypothetical protein